MVKIVVVFMSHLRNTDVRAVDDISLRTQHQFMFEAEGVHCSFIMLDDVSIQNTTLQLINLT